MSRRAIKQEENFENHFNQSTIDITPARRNIKIEEEEDRKLAAEENPGEANLIVQADWRHRINQEDIDNSRIELKNIRLKTECY